MTVKYYPELVQGSDEWLAMEGLLRPVIEAPVVVAFPARRHGSDWTREDGA